MAQEFLDGVQVRAGLQEMGSKRMTQRMHGGRGEVELFAGHDDQPLEGGTRHRAGGGASGYRLQGAARAGAPKGLDR